MEKLAWKEASAEQLVPHSDPGLFEQTWANVRPV